jgi:uncharacterized repeat protein (TIGR03803 family)
MRNQSHRHGSRNDPAAPLRLFLTAAALCALTTGAAQAQVTQTVLHVFGIGKDGGGPSGNLLADNTGPSETLRGLYGTAFHGAHDTCTDGCGMVFKFTPPKAGQANWKETALWNFTGGADGASPALAGLFAMTKRIKADTTLYGTASTGGASNAGTVFALTGKKLTTLWAFTGGSDGDYPEGAVVADKSGALYVTAEYGGQSFGFAGCGTVIKLTPPGKGQNTWTETTIWTFTDGNDGCSPGNGLIIDKSGALYGTATNGGKNGYGTVFELIPPQGQQTAWTEQTLWAFADGADGAFSFAPLTAGKGGVLYGTTYEGGTNDDGVVFSLTPPKNGNGPYTEQTVWTFTGGNDGAYPEAPVTLDKSGVLYGTTSYGANKNGSAFKLTPPAQRHGAWTETTLWDFSGTDGSQPCAGLTADKHGVLYGTTYQGGSGTNCGGASGCGVAFSLTGTGFVP